MIRPIRFSGEFKWDGSPEMLARIRQEIGEYALEDVLSVSSAEDECLLLTTSAYGETATSVVRPGEWLLIRCTLGMLAAEALMKGSFAIMSEEEYQDYRRKLAEAKPHVVRIVHS